jgi:hypothetical protein
VRGPGGDLEAVGHTVAGHDEGVVAGCRERRRQTREHAASIMLNRRGLAMHHAAGALDTPAEHLADGLVTEADAEDRNPAGETFDQRLGNTGLRRRARTRRDHDLLRRQRLDLVGRDLVVANDVHIRAEFRQILYNVESKRVVVVDHQQHGSYPFPEPASTMAAARSTARALFRVSCHSEAGTESATTPAPTWMCSSPSLSLRCGSRSPCPCLPPRTGSRRRHRRRRA